MKTPKARLKELPAETRNGTKIDLFANTELPRELDNVRDSAAEGDRPFAQ